MRTAGERRRAADRAIVRPDRDALSRTGEPGRTTAIAAFLGFLLVPACGTAPTDRGSDLDAVPSIAIEEQLRIGSMDDPDYGFSGIAGVDVDRDGRVYVGETVDVQIRVYSADGRLLRRLGGRGEGPGEFRRIPRFGVTGDTVWAIETSTRRITLFHRDGSLISTAPFRGVTVHLQNYVGTVMPTVMRDDGTFLGELVSYTRPRDVELEVGAKDTVQVPRVLFDARGNPVDTIGWLPRFPPNLATGERIRVGELRYNVPRPPTDDPIVVALPDGHVILERPLPQSGETAELRITRFGLKGDTVFRRTFRYRPRPYDDVALDTVAWRSARTPGGGIPIVGGVLMYPTLPDDSLEAFRRIRDMLEFPPFQPASQYQRIGRDHTLWLMREENGGPSRRWTLIDPAGSLVGTVTLPRNLRLLWSDGTTLWAIAPDEFDVPWLVRYRMSPG